MHPLSAPSWLLQDAKNVRDPLLVSDLYKLWALQPVDWTDAWFARAVQRIGSLVRLTLNVTRRCACQTTFCVRTFAITSARCKYDPSNVSMGCVTLL